MDVTTRSETGNIFIEDFLSMRIGMLR